MAGADVIEAAVGITLLLIVSYVVLGGITMAASTVSTAKKDMTLLQEERLGTNMVITYAAESGDFSPHDIRFNIKNTGNTVIDYKTMEIIVVTDGEPSTYYCYMMDGGNWVSGNLGTWNFDYIHKDENGRYANGDPKYPDELVNIDQWDPGEYLYGWIGFSQNPIGIYAFTQNGATAYRAVL